MLRRIAWSALLAALLGTIMPAEGLERVYASFPICNESEAPTILSELKTSWSPLAWAQRPLNISFEPISDWTKDNWVTYYVDGILPRTIVSIVFFGLTLLMLLGLIVWRIARCSSILWCKKCSRCKPGISIRQEVLKSREMRVSKVIMVVLCLGIIGASIWGLTLDNKSVIEGVWLSVEAIQDYAIEVVRSMHDLVDSLLNQHEHALDAVDWIERQQAASATPVDMSPMTSLLTGLIVQLANAAVELQSGAATITNELITRVQTGTDKWEENTLHYWSILATCSVVALACSIGFAVVVSVASLLNWGLGVSLMSSLVMIVSLLCFAICFALNNLIAGASDLCTNMNELIILEAPDSLVQLVQFYLDPNGTTIQPPPSVEAFLASAGIANATEIRLLVNQTIGQTQAALESFLPLLPSSMQSELQYLAGNITGGSIESLRLLGQSEPPASGLMMLTSFWKVHAAYTSSKHYVCCQFPTIAARLWILLLAVGIVFMVVTALTFVVMSELDKMPESGACCSWRVMWGQRELPQPGKPMSVETDSGRVSGVDENNPIYQLSHDGMVSIHVIGPTVTGVPVMVAPGAQAMGPS